MPPVIHIDGREVLTINQVRARAGVSRRTVYHWVQFNKVQWVRMAGGRLRIFADSLVQSTEKCNGYSPTSPKGPNADPE